jgi:hypothetical protein
MAVPRVRGINPSRLTCWNEPDSDNLCHDGALVSDDVHVLATVVNKRHPELWTFELKFHFFRPDARPAQLASRS